MGNILSVSVGFPSILYPSVELARRLAAAGHRVTFAGLPGARELVEHHGLAFLPLEPSRYQQFLEADAKLGFWQKVRRLGRRRRQAKNSMAVSGFAQALRTVKPDLILIDGEMHEHIILASATGVPIALLNSFASIWRLPGLPPAHCLVRPGVGWQGTRFGMWLLWLALRWRKRGRAMSHWFRRSGCDRVSILRALARDAGFDLRRETDTSQWLIPFTYRRFPVLSLHAWEFEFPHRPPERVHYVGPQLLDARVDRPVSDESRTELDALFAYHDRSGGESKLIYAGFGSTLSADLCFLKRLVGVVEERPGWELVVSLSDRIVPADLGSLPERVHIFPWVAQRQVLSRADAVVTHGGINTLDECVIAGVPMLVYCGFETDMAGNAARVLHHGIGLAGDRRRDSTAAIRGHIDRLLTEPRFRENLGGLRGHYQAYDTQRVAETIVASLLGGDAR